MIEMSTAYRTQKNLIKDLSLIEVFGLESRGNPPIPPEQRECVVGSLCGKQQPKVFYKLYVQEVLSIF